MYELFMIGATEQEKQNEYRMTRVGRQFCCLDIQFNVIPNPLYMIRDLCIIHEMAGTRSHETGERELGAGRRIKMMA